MSPLRRSLRTTAPLVPTLCAACSPQQSAFSPTGVEAERVNTLFWIMTGAGGVLLLLVMVATALAIVGPASLRTKLSSQSVIVWLGIVMPAILLTALLAWGLSLMGINARPASETRLTVEISGEQWWWRVTYLHRDGREVATANELHLPVGEPVTLRLTTADVIHSFWAPQLAGKLDMIPGRTNTMQVTATKAGVSRGQCAEYCGGAHALMSFHVVAQNPADFDAWLEQEAAPAAAPQSAQQQAGANIFEQTGCGACHTIRGTRANGVIGPDLTHVGSRRSLAAATLPNNAEAFARWIRNNQHIKPENKMPGYSILPDDQLSSLATYLESLK